MSGNSAQNLLILLSDEHHHGVLGCAGNPAVHTPNLDRLASRGTRFSRAYCNSPICVPARASLATGRYPHETRCWDNATPYHGQIRSWHHALRDRGHEVVSIGKLHFRSAEDDNGFSDEILPMHVLHGVGDLPGLLRRELPPKHGVADLANQAGIGTSDYATYDASIAREASDWLGARGASRAERPWALLVSFVLPHFPLVAPADFFARYADAELPSPGFHAGTPTPTHPVLERMRAYFSYDRHFDAQRRATAVRAYYGMVSYLDHNVGLVLEALERAGLAGGTRVLYTSDHGDSLGHRGMWGKSTMYDDSAAIPMIAAGCGVPSGRVCNTPVSLIDVFPTAMDAVAGEGPAEGRLPGRSLLEIASASDADRSVFAEYHASGAPTGVFMLRHGRYKLVHYEDHEPQLFDLETDPLEYHDLAPEPAQAHTVARLGAELDAIVDTRAATAAAFADQAAVIERHGGRDAVLDATQIPYTPAPVFGDWAQPTSSAR